MLLFIDIITVHGGWADWGEFGECSVSCGGGLKKRFRTCSKPSPSNNGRPCRGQADDTQSCNRDPCPGNKHYIKKYLLSLYL